MNDEMAGLVKNVADMLQVSQDALIRMAIKEYMERREYA